MYTETSRVAKLLADQAEEIVKLKQQNAELVKALKYYACGCKNGTCESPYSDCGDVARDAIAKATGGE